MVVGFVARPLYTSVYGNLSPQKHGKKHTSSGHRKIANHCEALCDYAICSHELLRCRVRNPFRYFHAGKYDPPSNRGTQHIEVEIQTSIACV